MLPGSPAEGRAEAADVPSRCAPAVSSFGSPVSLPVEAFRHGKGQGEVTLMFSVKVKEHGDEGQGPIRV